MKAVAVPYLRLFATAVIAMVASLALTPLAKALLKRFGIVDMPSARRINKTPIPRGGGIAVVASFALAVAFAIRVLGLADPVWTSDFTPYALGAAACIVLAGMLDDIFGLKPVTKLAAQIAAACIVFAGDVSFGHLILFAVPEWLDLLITIGWFVIIINAFNLIDGLDGLASGLAVIGATGLIATQTIRGFGCNTLAFYALAGACLGFLRYNYNPASVFLGDSGSLFLGFILALTPLAAGGKAVFVASVGVPLLAVGLPLFDTSLAILRRSARVILGSGKGFGEIVSADVEHLHHRLLTGGMNQRKAAAVLYALASVLVLAAIAISVKTVPSVGALILGVLTVIALIGRQLTRVELWYVGNAMDSKLASLPFRLLAVIYIVLDIIILVIAWWWAASLTLIPHIGMSGLHFSKEFPVFLFFILGSFAAFRIYRRRWDYSQGSDFFVLMLALFCGWLAAYTLLNTFTSVYLGFNRHGVVFLAMASIPLLVIRFLRITLRALIANVRHTDESGLNAIIYGSGIGFFVLYALFKRRFVDSDSKPIIKAVVDDDPDVVGSYTQGFRVRNAVDLEAIISETGATSLIVAKPLPTKRLRYVLKLANRRNLHVKQFFYSLKNVNSARTN